MPVIPPFDNLLTQPAFAGMRKVPQWVVWKLVWDEKRNEWTKRPASRSGYAPVAAGLPCNWSDAETAAADATRLNTGGPRQYGIGFYFSRGCGYWFLDLDHAFRDGDWSQFSKDVLQRYFPGAASEVSVRGEGLHLYGKGAVLPHGNKCPQEGAEFYTDDRFAACTGTYAQGDCDSDHSATLVWFVPHYFPAPAQALASSVDWTTEPVEGWRNPLTDEQLHALLDGTAPERATPQQVFGGKHDDRVTKLSLHQLWTTNPDVFHAQGVRSEARQSLLVRLMYLVGGNCERVHDLTALHDLAVKNDREALHRDEILKAYALFMNWWLPEKDRRDAQQAETRRIGESLGDAVTPTVMSLSQMITDLVYVNRGKIVVHRGTRKSLKWDEAAGAYAASRHQFVEGGKERDLAALPLWRAHGERHTVDVLAWDPAGGEFCAPADGAGGATTAYNTFRGLKPLPAPENWREWVVSFVQHVAYLVPIEAERTRFMQWLAHIVQRPGELPHTCYLMIAHEFGIGRNWLASVLARVLSGYVAAGVPLADVLDGKFNGYLSEKLLATVDETREGLSTNRYVRGEALKRLVTEEYRHINHKFGLQVVEVNGCRWLMFSNHDDALPFDNGDRRVIVIENPSHRQSQDYYTALYAHIRYPEFIASVREYLRTLPLDGFNPGAHAPMNAAKQRALEVMAPSIDRAIREFIEAWPTPFTTVDDVRRAVAEITGETPKDAALTHAMRRAGLVSAGERMRIDGRREFPLAVNVPPEVLAQYAPDQIAASIKEGRKKFNS
jgi:hypothetical protein